MGKVRQKISNGFQWHLKWVRVMLIVSVLAVLGVIFFPVGNKESMSEISMMTADSLAVHKPIMDTIIYANTLNDSLRFIVKRLEPVPPPPAEASRSIASTEEPTIEEKKPFDWKGTITWAIGAINGLVLVVLNIKNLLFKKT